VCTVTTLPFFSLEVKPTSKQTNKNIKEMRPA
jgi:hypothetical protein